MSRGIMVVDIPDTCYACPMMNGSDECILQDEDTNATYIDDYVGLRQGCPIKEIPQKKEVQGVPRHPGMGDFMRIGYQKGWNACIDEILKGGDES